MIKPGDRVIVYPHGSPAQSAIGKVLLCSTNQRAISVGFEDRPPFAIGGGYGIFVGPIGVVLMAYRVGLNGKAWGPWIEVVGGGHYEIELAV